MGTFTVLRVKGQVKCVQQLNEKKAIGYKKRNDFKEAEAQERATDNAGCGAILLKWGGPLRLTGKNTSCV